MTRIRWFRVDPVADLLASLRREVQREYLTITPSGGFVASEVSRSRIESTFIERVVIKDTVEDPFGNVETYERVEYRRTEFSVTSQFPELQLRNAPRSRREFLFRLGELAEHAIAIEPVRINIMATIRNLEKAMGAIRVCQIEISGVPLSTNANATVVVSGAGDVRKEARKFSEEACSVVSSAKVCWSHGRADHSCEISAFGISFDDEIDTKLERAVRDVLSTVE